MRIVLGALVFAIALVAADQPKPIQAEPKPTLESVQAENASLKAQLEALRRAVVLEIKIQAGALQACRDESLKEPPKAQQPAKQVVP